MNFPTLFLRNIWCDPLPGKLKIPFPLLHHPSLPYAISAREWVQAMLWVHADAFGPETSVMSDDWNLDRRHQRHQGVVWSLALAIWRWCIAVKVSRVWRWQVVKHYLSDTVGLEVWMQVKQLHNFVQNAFDVPASWTMKSVLAPWRTRMVSVLRRMQRGSFLLLVWIHFFLQSFSVLLNLLRNHLCLEDLPSFCNQELVIDGHCSSSEAATSNALNEAWPCKTPRQAWSQPNQLGWIRYKNWSTGGTLASRSCRYTTAAYWVGFQIAFCCFLHVSRKHVAGFSTLGSAVCDLPWLYILSLKLRQFGSHEQIRVDGDVCL